MWNQQYCAKALYFLNFLNYRITYLKGRVRERERRSFYKLVHSFKRPQWPELAWDEARHLLVHSDLPGGWQGPKFLGHSPLLFQVH